VLSAFLVVAAVVVGCASSQPTRSSVSTVAQQLGSVSSSAIVLVSDHGHSTVATAGRPRPAAGQRFRVASVTKTFTATLVLQLVDQKRLGLDDPVRRYLPGVLPAEDTITIRQLLAHRSGLVDFTDYDAWLRKAVHSTSIGPIEALRFAASKPLLFKPGSGRGYSNTNYVALGLVIEKVTGHSFGQELRQRILEPLALSHTELATTARLPDLPDRIYDPALWSAEAGIVSSAQDLARFFTALLSGRLISRASLAQMKPTAGNPYGFALTAGRLPCGRIYATYGTDFFDYWTSVFASGDGARVVVASVYRPARNRPKGTETPDPSPLICPTPSRSAG
jgi:D-alanyl-D-alanine carboxypeptidase